jgi:hypothetical protein
MPSLEKGKLQYSVSPDAGSEEQLTVAPAPVMVSDEFKKRYVPGASVTFELIVMSTA